jgi:tetraacyldisaccharide 4'-kinase
VTSQAWFNRIWYGGAAPPWWLLPGAWLYAMAANSRRFLYRRRWLKAVLLGCPVVVVGNLSAGGTGKTPLVCWLVARLLERGYRPGIVTRGYGGSSRDIRLVGGGDDPADVGDEAVLLARRGGVPVAAGRDRPAAAQRLIDIGCNVIVSDDGLQHYALARDCEIAVIDGARRFGNGRLLPAGPLREAPKRLASVDAVVVNGGGPPPAGEFGMRVVGDAAVAMRDGTVRPLGAFAGTQVHAVAGIGNPQRFFDLLQGHGIDVIAHPLDDHARIEERDILFSDGKPVLMTEKDAVKCARIVDGSHWYVAVSAVFGDADADALLEIVARAITAAGLRSNED